MKIKITKDSIIVSKRNLKMEALNEDFMKEEVKMQEQLNPNRTSLEEIADTIEVIANTGQAVEYYEFERKYRKTYINDEELGDLLIISHEQPSEFSVELPPFDTVWAKTLGQGEVYIKTQVNELGRNEKK
jgi:hypothetical protein